MGLIFSILFAFKYVRSTGHTIVDSFFYEPDPIPDKPSYFPDDVTVILPTVDSSNNDFKECLLTCLMNKPYEIIIVVVGEAVEEQIYSVINELGNDFVTEIRVLSADKANKREQIALAVPYVQTKLTFLLDDHVFWPSPKFIQTTLAPFENPKIGGVGTEKRVRRVKQDSWSAAFWNVLGALYLERHNLDIRGTNSMDGGVFVISGRTAAYRTEILKNKQFLHEFIHETFGSRPVVPGDDNFITRYLDNNGWDIKIQSCQDAVIETTLGTFPRFLSQCIRWSRTTWHSNTVSLFIDRSVWRRRPWCVYAVYLTNYVNFALIYDPALVYSFSRTRWGDRLGLICLLTWMLLFKFIKVRRYCLREPWDLVFFPGYVAFTYFHTSIKLYSLLTVTDTSWAGRDFGSIEMREKPLRDEQQIERISSFVHWKEI